MKKREKVISLGFAHPPSEEEANSSSRFTTTQEVLPSAPSFQAAATTRSR